MRGECEGEDSCGWSNYKLVSHTLACVTLPVTCPPLHVHVMMIYCKEKYTINCYRSIFRGHNVQCLHVWARGCMCVCICVCFIDQSCLWLSKLDSEWIYEHINNMETWSACVPIIHGLRPNVNVHSLGNATELTFPLTTPDIYSLSLWSEHLSMFAGRYLETGMSPTSTPCLKTCFTQTPSFVDNAGRKPSCDI